MPVLMAGAAAAALWLALLALLALVARFLRRYIRFRAMEMAIPGPASLPLLGNLLDMAHVTEDGKLDALQALWGERRGDISRMTLGNQMLVFVSDPDDIGKVLKDKRFASKPHLYYGFMKLLVGNGLTVSSGPLWKAHRAWVQPAFHPDVLDRFVEVFSEEAEALVRRLRPGEHGEVVHGFREVTARCALRTGLSSDLAAENQSALHAIIRGIEPMLRVINARSFRPWLWPSAIFDVTPAGRSMHRYARVGTDFMQGVLSRKRRQREQPRHADDEDDDAAPGVRPQRKTFIDIVLDTEAESRARFSDLEILDESKTFFATATEISASAIGFLLKLLSIRPDVQERVVAELDGVFGDSDRGVTKDDLSRLAYLECVIKESLRLLPTIPFVARDVAEDTDFNGKTIPAGAIILVHILAAHRDPRYHADPDRFDPERFAGERAAAMHPFSYLPFSGGPRNCIGQRYAMLQMKTIVATVLRAFRVEAADDGLGDPSQFPLTFDMTLRIIGGTRVKFAAR